MERSHPQYVQSRPYRVIQLFKRIFLKCAPFNCANRCWVKQMSLFFDRYYLMLVQIFAFISIKKLVKNLQNHDNEYYLENLKTDVALKASFLVSITFLNLPTKSLECNWYYVTNTNTLSNHHNLLNLQILLDKLFNSNISILFFFETCSKKKGTVVSLIIFAIDSFLFVKYNHFSETKANS